MGFFKPNWAKLARKAEKALGATDLGGAYHYFGAAIEHAPDGEKAGLTERREDCANRIYARNMALGEDFANRPTTAFDELGRGPIPDWMERAREHFELALQYATDDERKRLAEKALGTAGKNRKRTTGL